MTLNSQILEEYHIARSSYDRLVNERLNQEARLSSLRYEYEATADRLKIALDNEENALLKLQEILNDL